LTKFTKAKIHHPFMLELVIKVKKWAAHVTLDGKSKCVGYFEEEIDAAKARDEAVKKYNLNSRLNFPNE